MPAPASSCLALDIGGANIKAAHSSGPIRSLPFPLWRSPDKLPSILRDLLATLPPSDRVALTMTAELCDCYPTKRAGVLAVLNALTESVPEQQIHVWSIDSDFHSVPHIRAHPLLAAASNWLALANVAATLTSQSPSLLIDIGSTTTDLIPLVNRRVAALGRTDAERLQHRELLYAGVRRTPLCALADQLPFRLKSTPLAAELFATTLDVFLTLGHITDDPANLDTADNRPATAEFARDRLARMVAADRETFTSEDALHLSESLRQLFLAKLAQAAEISCVTRFGRPKIIVISGFGEFLAAQLAPRLLAPGGSILSLSTLWAPEAAAAACASALLQLIDNPSLINSQ